MTRTATSRSPSAWSAPPPPTGPSWSSCPRSGTCSAAARGAARGRRAARRPEPRPRPAAGRASSASTCSPAASPSASTGQEQLSNTSVLIGPDGDDLAAYRKIHMFDVDVGGVAYRESEHEQAGDEIVVADPPAGVDGRAQRLLRPPLPRALPDPRGAGRPAVHRPLRVHGRRPGAPTGRSCCAPARSRTRPSSSPRARPARRRRTTRLWGHSMIVDPSGEVLAAAAARARRRRRRPRPRRAQSAVQRGAALLRQPPPERLPLARR